MKLISELQRFLARSEFSAYVAIKVRNQCREIISYYIGKENDGHKNGEYWFLDNYIPDYGGCFFDIGANKGEWSIYTNQACSGNCEIYSYEPDPRAANKFKKNTENIDNIYFSEKGVGSKEGEVSLYLSDESTELSTMRPVNRKDYSENRVNITTIDNEVKRNDVDCINLMKVDVEGYEAEVLRGASESLKKGIIECVQFEYGENWIYSGNTITEVISFLSKMGFKTFLLQPGSIESEHIKILGEYFSYSNFISIREDKLEKIKKIKRDKKFKYV
jgi:FkbM family methyltransferase